METNINYLSWEIPDSQSAGYPTAEACRIYCECEHNAPFFSWSDNNNDNSQTCWCKGSTNNLSPTQSVGALSGVAKGCNGASEYSTLNNYFY